MKNRKNLSVAFFVMSFALAATVLFPATKADAAEAETDLTAALQASDSSDGSFAEEARVNYTKNISTGTEDILEVTGTESDWSISFKSSDTDVLTVEQLSDNTCLYRGEASGTAKITVTIKKTTLFIFREKRTIKAKVNVTPSAVSIKFQSGTKEVEVGQKVALPVTIRPSISKEKPVYASSNKKIAKVGSAGKVTGKKVGVVTITATIANGNSARCKVCVVSASP